MTGPTDVVGAAFAAFAEGGPDAVFEFLDPEIEWHLRPDFPDAGVFHGYDEVRGLFRRFEELFDDLYNEPLEFIEVGDDRVVVPLEWGGTGKIGGVGVAERQGETWVATVRDGKIAKVVEYRERAEALEAVGLAG